MAQPSGGRPDERTQRSLNDRVLHYGLTKGIERGLATGLARLPLDEATRAAIRARSGTIVTTLADTGVTLVNGAMAARAAAAARAATLRAPSSPEPDVVVPPPAPVPAGGGLVDQLERLAALHSAGDIDDEEYRAAKERVLRRTP
ncbi:SHOCT domain-containing protein [Cellulomonas endophytica]|uniref:SHOCT domain-containing protein n=1 Tax=Cellulomonas endophytica TaxID=2494735 RepID=UPI00101207BE|nr:SHOCT domain-containing protein [Cellulomonas endophytica]